MAVPLAIWLLVLTSVCPSTTNPVTNTSELPTSANSAESSGSREIDSSTNDVTFTTTEMSTFSSSTNRIYTSESTVTTSGPVPIGAAIMKFINDHMSLIIIAGVLLILLIIIVCTVVLVKQSYKASAYYPSSYPKKKYVDEQDKGGSTKTFNELPEKVNDETKEDGGSSSKQLEADLLTATHNLKKKTPSKGEADAAEKGESSQTTDKEGGSSTSPGAGAKEGKGQTSDTTENKDDKAHETDCKEAGSEKLPKEKEQKEAGEGAGRGNNESDDEKGKAQGAKKKLESGEDSSTSSNQIADATKTKGMDNVVSPEGQEPKEVKLAQQGFNEESTVAEPSADNVSNLEKTPLIPNPNGVPNDSRAC
ncbi:transmembrane protein 119b [Carcharodon carcharias]|uniref:transmembrane protein 119b n=1 Tax=Carcharodon carcharias TaxID=13397 RepID=UPI001B7E3110|nr:transmembrane protein 119b [Carcharodon carcharias]